MNKEEATQRIQKVVDSLPTMSDQDFMLMLNLLINKQGLKPQEDVDAGDGTCLFVYGHVNTDGGKHAMLSTVIGGTVDLIGAIHILIMQHSEGSKSNYRSILKMLKEQSKDHSLVNSLKRLHESK